MSTTFGMITDKTAMLKEVESKFYYAGGSCRFMFHYSTDDVKCEINKAVNSVKKKDTDPGVFSSDAVHSLMNSFTNSESAIDIDLLSNFAAEMMLEISGGDLVQWGVWRRPGAMGCVKETWCHVVSGGEEVWLHIVIKQYASSYSRTVISRSVQDACFFLWYR